MTVAVRPRRYRCRVRGFPVVLVGVVLVGVVLAGVLGGCAGSVDGGAEPFVGLELPPRPREVPVQGVDPCALLTETQQAELELDSPMLFSPSVGSALFEGPDPLCTTGAFDPRAFGVAIALPYDGLGIGALTARPVRSELTPLDVQGFPAVLARPDDPLFCQVVVDVAPGQAVSVQFRDGGDRNIPQDELCDGAVEVADAAMATLLSLY